MNRNDWQKRYDNPVRMSLDPAPAGSWDHERLFVPELHAERGANVSTAYDQHMERRQAQIRGATGPDLERAQLMERAERSGMQHYNSAELAQGLPRTSVGALEARQDLMERERSMAKLVEHDRSHGHPMTQDPQRSPDSATWDEKRQWAERDGRRLQHEERTTLSANGAFDPFRRAQDLAPTPKELGSQVMEQAASFAVSPEPVSHVAQVLMQGSRMGKAVEQSQPANVQATTQENDQPVQRRSSMMNKLNPQPVQKSPEQESQQEQPQRRSSLAALIQSRMAERPVARQPERQQEHSLSR